MGTALLVGLPPVVWVIGLVIAIGHEYMKGKKDEQC